MTILKRPLVASVIGTLLILAIHFVLPSYMNGRTKNTGLNPRVLWESEAASDIHRARLEVSEFARRPLTSGFQTLLHDHLNIPLQFSFNVLVLLSIFGSCLLLNRIAAGRSDSSGDSWLAIYAFIFSFTTIFAFLAPMHTYDEPLQFFLILLSMLLFKKGHAVSSMLIFTIACVARETSLFLLPFFVLTRNNQTPLFKSIALWMVPVIFYIIYFLFLVNPVVQQQSIAFNSGHRFTGWTENFKDLTVSIRSVTNAFLVIGLPLILTRRYRHLLSAEDKRTVGIAEVLLYLNAVLVLVTGLAKEPRLFAIPLLLIWPLLPKLLVQAWQDVKATTKKMPFKVMSITWACLLFAFLIYNPGDLRVGVIFQGYLFVYLTACLLTVLPADSA